MWTQSDLVLGVSAVNMLLCYGNLILHPLLSSKYYMLMHQQKEKGHKEMERLIFTRSHGWYKKVGIL